jgi:UDP-glucose 4-epimerase
MQASTGPVRRVLVIGWGFVGAAVGRRLRDAGCEVRGLTRSETPRTAAARALGCQIAFGEAAQADKVREALRGVDHVVLAGGGLTPPLAAAAPLDDVLAMVNPLLTVLEALRTCPGVGLTYVSSGGTVYGNPTGLPVPETAPLRPVSPYGASRVAAETYVGVYSRTFGIPTRIVRCANVYGPGQAHDRGQGAVAVFLHRVAQGLPITVIGDGSAQRDYIHIDDVADAISRLIVQDVAVDAVNVGTGTGHAVMDVVDIVSDVVGRPAVLDFQPARNEDVGAIVLDISRLRSLIDFTPRTLREGVAQTWRESAVATGDYRAVTNSE